MNMLKLDWQTSGCHQKYRILGEIPLDPLLEQSPMASIKQDLTNRNESVERVYGFNTENRFS